MMKDLEVTPTPEGGLFIDFGEIGVALIDIGLASGEVSSDETQAAVVENHVYCYPSFVSCHSSQPYLRIHH